MPKIPSQSSIPESIKPWPLPKHWAWVRIDSVGLVQLGKQLTRERRPGDRLVPYLRAANITMEGLDLSDLQEMAMSPMEVERYALAKGDVVLTEASGSAAHVGKSAVWRGEVDLCAIQNHVIRFRPHAVLSEYAQIVFRAFLVMGHFAKVARGVGIQNLGAARFAELLFPLAPMATQKGIAAVLGSPRLFQRLRFHGWLKPLYQSRDPLFPVERVLSVQQRLEGGEVPPLLPCEVRQRSRAIRAKSIVPPDRISAA